MRTNVGARVPHPPPVQTVGGEVSLVNNFELVSTAGLKALRSVGELAAAPRALQSCKAPACDSPGL
jgi:hypothetical protein